MSLDFYLECEVLTGARKEYHEVWQGNLTHNLNDMARYLDVYDCLWKPGELEKPYRKASQLRDKLNAAIKKMADNREECKTYNPKNGWGDYDNMFRFLSSLLEACEQYPIAKITVSR